jgi:23S rRNA (uracil1939-C5)-methyltransferase
MKLTLEKPVVLEKPVYGGDCLARDISAGGKAGKTIFIPLTLPGETVTAHVTEEKRGFAKAELDEILTASPSRVAPPCPHFGACGGCHYQHADYAMQLAMKLQILRETLARAGVATPLQWGVDAGNPWGYRNRIRVAFTPEGGFGYRSRRSHSIVPIDECPITGPKLFQIAKQIAKFIAENLGAITISELELFSNCDETQILLTLDCEPASADGAQLWLAELQAALPPQVAGLRLQLSGGSPYSRVLANAGETQLTYFAAGFAYRVDHGAFFQVNRWLIDSFVSLVTANRSGEIAWDLFAGVGLFARPLTANFAQVLAVESAPASFAALRHNLEATAGRAVSSTTLDFLRRNREQREPRPDLIVLDPPRAGLGEETTSLLNAIHAPEMVYVSCDPATLARDLRALTQERYRIEKITLVDMFPQTFHMETVVDLRRC